LIEHGLTSAPTQYRLYGRRASNLGINSLSSSAGHV